MDFTGKVVIVTGAAQGMGASHARAFVDHGATVILTDVNVTAGQAMATSLGDHAHFMSHDVTSDTAWQTVVDETVRRFGHLDVLVNNAGITYSRSLFDVSTADYLKIVKINQLSVFLGTKYAAAVMKRQQAGSIVNISSINGLVGGAVGYTDTKFAVRGLTKAAALELAPYGIRVNSVHPGVIDTPMIHQGDTDDVVQQFAKAIPLRRVAQPVEISRAVLFLASPDASYATGAEFVLDGGLTAQ